MFSSFNIKWYRTTACAFLVSLRLLLAFTITYRQIPFSREAFQSAKWTEYQNMNAQYGNNPCPSQHKMDLVPNEKELKSCTHQYEIIPILLVRNGPVSE